MKPTAKEMRFIVELIKWGELGYRLRPPFGAYIVNTGWSQSGYLAQSTGAGYVVAVQHLPAEAADVVHHQNPHCIPDF